MSAYDAGEQRADTLTMTGSSDTSAVQRYLPRRIEALEARIEALEARIEVLEEAEEHGQIQYLVPHYIGSEFTGQHSVG